MVKVVGQNCVGYVGVEGVVSTGVCTNEVGCGAAVEDAHCGKGVVACGYGECWVCVVGVMPVLPCDQGRVTSGLGVMGGQCVVGG